MRALSVLALLLPLLAVVAEDAAPAPAPTEAPAADPAPDADAPATGDAKPAQPAADGADQAAGDAKPATDAKPDPDAKAVAAADPTAAVVTQGRFVYRARDLDALTLIAARHAKRKLTRAEEDQLRQALTQLLVAREPLLEAIAYLPALPGPARDQLLLDLIDYQAERAAPPAAHAADGRDAGAKAGAAGGDIIVRLPPLTLTRVLDQIGKRQLTLGLALYFTDAQLAKKLEAKAPLIQDAVLGHLNQLPAKDFAQPNHETLKLGLAASIGSRVPEFPSDGVLITQLEVEEPAAAAPADPDERKDPKQP